MRTCITGKPCNQVSGCNCKDCKLEKKIRKWRKKFLAYCKELAKEMNKRGIVDFRDPVRVFELSKSELGDLCSIAIEQEN